MSTSNLGVMMGADLIERFREAGLQAAGQRRNVTVLFVDLTDYTRLSEAIDSEDLYEIIQQFINILVSSVYKYDGMVDKIVGDGLMALFGAPIGHENNAELAVLSALDMQTELSAFNQDLVHRLEHELKMHIGLHSGTVVVGGMGSNMLMDYTAIGDTVNLAHRLEEAADPDTILVSESIYRQTRMLFDYAVVPSLFLKGIQRAVTGYRVIGSKDRPGRVRGVEGLSSPMIGRDAELEQLKQAVQKMTQQTKGGFAMVFGEAGIGKSRLVRELRSQIDLDAIGIFEGQSLTYRRSVAYWIFFDVLRNYLGVSANAPEAHVRARLSDKGEKALGRRASEVIPYLEHLLSLKPTNAMAANRISQLDADQLRQQIFIAVRDLFVAESERRPVLLILDDLHWADDASLDLLQFMLDTVHSTALYICGISRPVDDGVLTKIVEQAQKRLKDHCITIKLTKLPQELSEQLLYQLLTIPELPPSLKEQVVQRAAGVPFYLEEILRMLIDDAIIYKDGAHWQLYPEADTSSIGVPDNLQALILARFDRLDRQQRRILQVSSAIGREFSVALVETVLSGLSGAWIEDQLSALVERGFIVSQTDSHQADYAFRHVLTSDAIYSTLLRRDRGELHGKIGEAIEVLYADRLSEYIYLLARHYSWSPCLDRALHYLILAGQKSARDFINSQAREYFEQALQILPQVEHEPMQAFDVYMGLGDVMVFGGEYENARERYRAAHDYLDDNMDDDPRHYIAVSRKIGKTCVRQGDYDEALVYLIQAQQSLDSCSTEFPIERAEIWHDIGWIHFRRGNFTEAEETLQEALDLVVDSGAYGVIASIYNRLGGVAYFQGEPDQAAEYLRNSISIRESIGDVAGLASSTNNLGILEKEMGLYDDALEDLKRNFELVKRLGQVEAIAVAHHNLGSLYTLRGEIEEAKQSLENALKLARQIGFSSLILEVQKNIGELELSLGHWAEAREVLTNLLSAFDELDASDQLLSIYLLLGEVSLGAGDLDQALMWASKVDTVAESFAHKRTKLPALQRGELLRFRGMLAMHKQDWRQAEQDLQQSVEVFEKLRSRLNIGRSLYQLGRLSIEQEQGETATRYFNEAAQIFREIGAQLEAQRAESYQQDDR
jgi:predicted ATPase/class 3 adenylate cyclase